MRKIIVGLLAIIALMVVGAPQAHAGWPGGVVFDQTGYSNGRYSNTVIMDGGARYTEWPGMDSTLWGRDANQFRMNDTWRCVSVNSAFYKAKPGNFFKVGNFQTVRTYIYSDGKCGDRPWLSTKLDRV